MDRKKQIAATYNEMFAVGGYEGVYDLPYYRSPYFSMYKAVLKALRKTGANSVLEVGCGTGAFASFLLEKANIRYTGFDFSEVAVKRARTTTGSDESFYTADATLAESYSGAFDAIVCTEVLEHLENDLGVITHWPSGTPVICTVPNYDSEYHERYFVNEEQVADRYGELIAIEKIFRVKKPALSDLSLANRLRQLRWQRYNPKRLMELLGMGNFDKVGGWFVVTGRRR